MDSSGVAGGHGFFFYLGPPESPETPLDQNIDKELSLQFIKTHKSTTHL